MTSVFRLFPCLSLLAVLASGLIATPASASQTADMGQLTNTIPVPAGLTRDEVKDVVALSLAQRGWSVLSNDEEKVVGYLKHRGNEATVTFLLSDSAVQTYCVGYAITKTGERKKPELPAGWLANLDRDITKRMNVAAVTK